MLIYSCIATEKIKYLVGGLPMKELIFGLIGGTALLMYGVDKMGESLEKASGSMMKKMLSILTGKVWSAFLVGTFLTALVQSSTAVTVLTVGFVSAGLMNLSQAMGVIYGANIGTTITAQLMAFSFSFKLTEIALPVLGIGFGISIISKNKNVKHIGEAIMGFGMMFLGLSILNSGIPYMQESSTLRYFFENYASNPIIAILLGIIATALVHSSAATVGLVMVLGQAGLLDLQAAICIMLGDNIGTCVTAQFASLTGTLNARRTAWGHSLYNIIGVLMVAIVLPYFTKLVEVFTNYIQPNAGLDAQIANSHTIFNLVTAIIFLPLNNYFVKFLEAIVRGKGEIEHENRAIYLDKLLLDSPAGALKASLSEIVRGIELSKEMVYNSMEGLFDPDFIEMADLHRNEDIINNLQKEITQYMVEVSKKPLTDTYSIMIPAMINSINNIERIGDHSIDIAKLTLEKKEKNLFFSEVAINELKSLRDMVIKMIDKSLEALNESEDPSVKDISRMEDIIDQYSKEISNHHITRLEEGKCTIESGVIFLEIVNHFERIADHVYKTAKLSKDGLKGKARQSLKGASK